MKKRQERRKKRELQGDEKQLLREDPRGTPCPSPWQPQQVPPPPFPSLLTGFVALFRRKRCFLFRHVSWERHLWDFHIPHPLFSITFGSDALCCLLSEGASACSRWCLSKPTRLSHGVAHCSHHNSPRCQFMEQIVLARRILRLTWDFCPYGWVAKERGWRRAPRRRVARGTRRRIQQHSDSSSTGPLSLCSCRLWQEFWPDLLWNSYRNCTSHAAAPDFAHNISVARSKSLFFVCFFSPGLLTLIVYNGSVCLFPCKTLCLPPKGKLCFSINTHTSRARLRLDRSILLPTDCACVLGQVHQHRALLQPKRC